MKNNEFYEIENGPCFSIGLSMSYSFLYNRFVGVMQFRFKNKESFDGAVDSINFKLLFNQKMVKCIKVNPRLKDLKVFPESLRVDYKKFIVSVHFEEAIEII